MSCAANTIKEMDRINRIDRIRLNNRP